MTFRTGMRRLGSRGLVTALLTGTVLLAGCSGDDDGAKGTTVGADDAGRSGGSEGSGGTGEVTRPTAASRIVPKAGDRNATSDGTTITVTGDRAAFASPSGNGFCVLTEKTAMCELDDRGFTPNPEHLLAGNPASCTVDKATAITLTSGQGTWTCPPAPLRRSASESAGGWWAKTVGGQTAKVAGLKVAVLPYGMKLKVGDVTCSSAETGISCNAADGRSFWVSRESFEYRL